jgi:hypothetical protein
MLGDPVVLMGQSREEKVVLGKQPQVDKGLNAPTRKLSKVRRWVDLLSRVRLQQLFVR